MPRSLRARLEAQLSADLEPLRLFTTGAEATAARSSGARAFAAGIHLVFAPGEFAPHTPAGLHRVAHEVVHALQQCGRVDGRSRWSLRDVRGSGARLRDPRPLPTSRRVPELSEIFTRHRAAATDEASRREIDRWRDSIGPSATPDEVDLAMGTFVADYVRGTPPAPTQAVFSCLFDAWKKRREWAMALAVWILANRGGAHLRLQTSFYDADFVEFFRSQDPLSSERSSLIWHTHPWFSGATRERFIAVLRRWFFAVNRSEAIQLRTGFAASVRSLIAEAANPSGLLEDDLTINAIRAVGELDQFRRRETQRAERDARRERPDTSSPAIRGLAANTFRLRVQGLTTSSSLLSGYSPIGRELIVANKGLMESIAAEATDFWRRATTTFMASYREHTGERPTLQADHRILQLLRRLPAFEPLAAAFRSTTTRLLARDEQGRILAAGPYATAVAELDGQLRTISVEHFERPLYRRATNPFATTRLEEVSGTMPGSRVVADPRAPTWTARQSEARDRALALGWGQLAVAFVRDELATYSPEIDASFAGLDDHRIEHRLVLAVALWGVGRALGLSDVVVRSNQVREGEEPRQRLHELALIGDWTRDPGAEIDQLAVDLVPDREIRGIEPLTPRDLVRFYQRHWFIDLADTIAAVLTEQRRARAQALAAGEAPPAPESLIVNAATQRLRQEDSRRGIRSPRRFRLAPVYFRAVERDPRTYATMLLAHPKTQAQISALGREGFITVVTERPVNRTALLWGVHGLGELVVELQRFPGMNEAIATALEDEAVITALRAELTRRESAARAREATVAEATTTTGAGPPTAQVTIARTRAELARMSPRDWLNQLTALHAAGQAASLAGVVDSFRQRSRGRLRSARVDRYEVQARRATNYERRVYRLDFLEGELIRRYEEAGRSGRFDRLRLGEVNYLMLDIPGLVVERVAHFERMAAPPEDANGQVAVLALELAPRLLEAIGDIRELDVAARYRPLMRWALARYDDTIRSKPADYYFSPVSTPPGWPDTQRDAATLLMARFAAVVEQVRSNFGFQGFRRLPSSANGALQDIDGGDVIEASSTQDRRFTIDGVRYELLQVERDFRYRPPVGTPSNFDEAGEPRSQLVVPSIGHEHNLDLAERRRVGRLFTIRRNGVVIPVSATDDEHLRELGYAVQMHAIIEELEGLAVVLEGFAELIQTGAEFVPGLGHAVLAARIATAVLAFLDGGELDQLIDLIRNDPVAQVRRAIDIVEQNFLNEVTVLNYLLWGQDLFDASVRSHRGPNPRRGLAGRSTSARLRRVVRNLSRVVQGLVAGFDRTRDRAQSTLFSIQLVIQRHPVLNAVLGFVGRWLPVIANSTLLQVLDELFPAPEPEAEVEATPATPAGETAEQRQQREARAQGLLERAEGQIQAQIRRLIDAIGGVEIPRQLIPPADIIQIALDIVLRRLGRRFAVGFEVVRALLELAGQWQNVERRVNDAIAGTPADPNQLWMNLVDRVLSPHVRAFRAFLVDGLWAVFEQVSFFSPPRPRARTPALSAVEDFQLPESELYAPAGPRRLAGFAPALGGSGHPLPDSSMRRAQRGFGHDFGHVRVHRGPRVDRSLGDIGALALTSGSHTALRGDLDLERGQGQRVLHHELAHVLQQAGPRPLGSQGDRTPRLGTVGAGLRWSPTREAAADALAERSLRSRDLRPLSVSSGAVGWMPNAGVDFGRRLLGKLTSFDEITERAHQDEGDAGGAAAPIPRELTDAVTNVAEQLRRVTSATGLRAVSRFNQSATKSAVADRLNRSERRRTLRRVVPELAQSAERTRTRNDEVERWVDPDDFGTHLERYLYGETGILLDLQIRTTGTGAARRIQAADPIGRAELMWIHLGEIHGGAALWELVLDGSYRPALTGADRTRKRRYCRLLIQQRGPSPTIFQGSHFRFTASFKRAVEDAIHESGGEVLAPGDLPSPQRYLSTDRQPSGGRVGNVGLRLGTYSQRENGQILDAPEREAHHITQYLLIQFFYNGHEGGQESDRSRRAFKGDLANWSTAHPGVQLASVYPGLTLTSSGRPARFDDIRIQPLIVGRGGLMPTISIARETHRRGGLHVSPSALDMDDRPTTQAGVLNEIFLSNLGPYREAEEAAQGGNLQPLRQLVRDRGRADRQSTFKAAMLATYAWMRGEMQPALRDALLSEEKRYYERLAHESNRPGLTLATSSLESVASRAVTFNNTGMGNLHGLNHWNWS